MSDDDVLVVFVGGVCNSGSDDMCVRLLKERLQNVLVDTEECVKIKALLFWNAAHGKHSATDNTESINLTSIILKFAFFIVLFQILLLSITFQFRLIYK